MKKKKVIIEGYFEIVEEKSKSIKELQKVKQKAIMQLAKNTKSMNFQIGLDKNNKWNVNYLLLAEDLKTGRAMLESFINRIEFIFNSKTKQIKRKESVIYG